MTGHVAVDDEPARRPVGAQLAVITDRAMAAPGDAMERVVFQELPAVRHGAEQLFLDWRWWVDARTERAEVERRVARAQSTGGAIPVPFKEVAALRKARYLKSGIVLAVVFLLLTASSVIGFWSWESWRAWGPALTLALLAGGRYYRQRWIMRLSWVPLPVFVALDISGWRWWPWWVAAGLLALAAEQRGMAMAREMPDPGAPVDARPGTSFPKLWRTVQDQLLVDHVTAELAHTRPIAIDGDEVGVAFGMTTLEEVTDKAVGNVARKLRLGRQQVRWTLSAKDAVGELIIYFVDTLASDSTPPVHRFGDLGYASAISVGRNDDGSPAFITLAYTHILVFGDTGSGKSSVVRLLIDAVESMPDAEVYGIDLAGPSLLGAQRKRLGENRVAFDVDGAHRLLDGLLAEAKRRNRALDSGMDGDEDGEVDERFVVADRAGQRGIVLVVGELTAFAAHSELVEKLLVFGDVARKTAMSLVVESPELAKQRLGPARAVIDIAMLIIAMACPFNDVVQAFGPSKIDAGWRPDILQPESEGERNDAGCGYIHGGGRNLPRITKFHTMRSASAAERRRMRRPQRDGWYAGREGETAPEAEYAVVVPEPLATLDRLTVNGDVRTATVLESLGGGWTARALGEALKAYGVAPTNVVVESVQGRTQGKGYKADQVKRAVAALDG